MLNRSILVANSDDCDPHAGREACQACALCTQEGIMQACRCCWSCNALYCRQVHSMVPSLFNQLCPCVGTYRSVFLHLNAAQRKWWPILIYSMYCSLNCKARTNFLANSTQRQQLGFSAKNMCIVHQNSSVHDGRELIIWHCTFQCMAHHLGTPGPTKADEFSENFQTASDWPPALVSENYVALFFGRC